jgi:hypothetical protein
METNMNDQGVKGLMAGLGCGFIGWGFDRGSYFLIGLGLALFFGSYLIPAAAAARS